MKTFIVVMKACCPSRTHIMEVDATDLNEAKRKASAFSNKGRRLMWKAWKVVSVKEKP